MSAPVDITGQTYNELTAIRSTGEKKNGNYVWEFLCSCGTVKNLACGHVIKGNTKSCGHLHSRKGSEHSDWKGFGEVSRTLWSRYQRNADSRDLEFSITIEEAWQLFLQQNRRCVLSGVVLQFGSMHTDAASITASLDRKDSSLGYVSGNVQWVHKEVNKLKGSFKDEDVIFWANAITNFQRSINEGNTDC